MALGWRAPTEAEIEAQEEDAASDLGGRGRFGGSLEEGFATTREADGRAWEDAGDAEGSREEPRRFAIGGGGAGAEDPRGARVFRRRRVREEEAAAKDPAGGVENLPPPSRRRSV